MKQSLFNDRFKVSRKSNPFTELSTSPRHPLRISLQHAPADLQRIVRRCLAKDPDERYQSIQDVAIELKELRRELEGDTNLDMTIPPSVFG